MIVVDIGCAPRGPEESVYKLVKAFHPDVLFGFDPDPDMVEGIERYQPGTTPDAAEKSTLIIRRRLAAWVDGRNAVGVIFDGICTGVEGDRRKDGVEVVAAFDLTTWLRTLPDDEIILKLDCEGAEYMLLDAINRQGLSQRLSRVIVEWHPPETAHGWYVPPDKRPVLACPVEDWEMW